MRRTSLALILAAALAAPAAADPIDDAAKTLDAAYARLKSYTAKTHSQQDTTMGPGSSYRARSEGTVEWLRQDGKSLYRNDMKTNVQQTMDGKETREEFITTIIHDGKFVWTLREDLIGEKKGKKMVTKSLAPPDTNGFKELREHFTVKLLPDETVDGASCTVAELRIKPMAGMPPQEGRTVWYFRKDIGASVKTVSYGKDKVDGTFTVTDLKLGASVSPDRFRFTPPPGAEITDLTAVQNTHGAAAHRTDAADNAKSDADSPPPAEDEKPKEPEPKKPEPKKPLLPKLPKLPG